MLRQTIVGDVRPITGGPPVANRADLGMSVLQYGTAIAAIVAVTLLAVLR